MLGNFTYCNPTKLYFGEDSLSGLNQELPKYGRNVLLVYGGGSIKKNGIYDKVVQFLRDNGKQIFEDPGVMPNPTVEKLYEGCERARACKADLILAECQLWTLQAEKTFFMSVFAGNVAGESNSRFFPCETIL